MIDDSQEETRWDRWRRDIRRLAAHPGCAPACTHSQAELAERWECPECGERVEWWEEQS